MRRTTATTAYLKECMGTALLELMKETPIERISIETMTAKADVGRSTYFRYFKTKDDVLVFKILCLWNRFSEENHISALQSNIPASSRIFFEFCLSIREISDMLYKAGHQNVILDAYLQILLPEKQTEDVYSYYRNNGIAYALYGIVNTWILRGYQESPEELTSILLGLQGQEV